MTNPTTIDRRSRRNVRRGFSIMEIMVTVLTIGILAALIVPMLADKSAAVASNKLKGDVATLNRLVALYKADGGTLADVSTPQGVIQKLKRSRSAAEQRTQVGVVTGRLVDLRLNARVSSGGTTERAVWNTASQKFEIKTNGASGATEFYLDDSMAGASPASDTRNASAVRYNGSSGWVWANGTEPYVTETFPDNMDGSQNDHPYDPSAPIPPSTTGTGSGSATGTATGSGTGTGTGTSVTPTSLPTPVLSPSPGTYAYSSFPSSVSISSNGATSGTFSLVYRLNGGPWSTYSSPITVPPGSYLEARNVATNALYTDSGTTGGGYYRLASGFTASSSAAWQNPSGGSSLVYAVNNQANESTLSHGSTVFDDGMGGTIDSGVENVITYKRKTITNVSPNTTFTLGELTMLNGTTFNDSEATSATLQVTLNFANPNETKLVNINFGMINTDNSPDRLSSADIVEIRNPNAGTVITIDGVNYRLELEWVTLDPGAGVVSGNQFLIFEGASARAELRARLVADR